MVLACALCNTIRPCLARTDPPNVVVVETTGSDGEGEVDVVGAVSVVGYQRSDWTNATSQSDLLATVQAIRAIRAMTTATNLMEDSAVASRRALRATNGPIAFMLSAANAALGRFLSSRSDNSDGAARDGGDTTRATADEQRPSRPSFDSFSGGTQRHDEAGDGGAGEQQSDDVVEALAQPIPQRGCMTRDPDAHDLEMVDQSTARHNHSTRSVAGGRGLGMWGACGPPSTAACERG